MPGPRSAGSGCSVSDEVQRRRAGIACGHASLTLARFARLSLSHEGRGTSLT
jgi:hypothetical protein